LIKAKIESKKNIVDQSPYRAEIRKMLIDGWSTIALEAYLAKKYEMKISHQMLRYYRDNHISKFERLGWDNFLDMKKEASLHIDIIGNRARLIMHQIERLEYSSKIEKSSGFLIAERGRQIALLNELLNDHKQDLQDVGLFPKAPEELNIGITKIEEHKITLAEMFNEDKQAAREFARFIADLEPASMETASKSE